MTSTQQFFVVSVILAVGVFLASLAARADVLPLSGPCPDLSGHYQIIGSSDVVTMTQTSLNGVTTYSSQHGERPVTKEDQVVVGQSSEFFDLQLTSVCAEGALEIISTDADLARFDSGEPFVLKNIDSPTIQTFVQRTRANKQNLIYSIVRTSALSRWAQQLVIGGHQVVSLRNASTGETLQQEIPLPTAPYAQLIP